MLTGYIAQFSAQFRLGHIVILTIDSEVVTGDDFGFYILIPAGFKNVHSLMASYFCVIFHIKQRHV